MTKNIFIYLILLGYKSAIGQTNETVKHIFYDLPLDKPRADIQKIIKADKRFKSTGKDTSYFNMYTYIGLTKDHGVIKSKPDSVEIELTYGAGASQNKKGKFKAKSMTYVHVRYYYSSKDSVDKEYQRVLSILRPIHKDTAFTHIDTVYSDSPIRSQYKAYGMTFTDSKSFYTVDVLNSTITKKHFGLFLEYKRDER